MTATIKNTPTITVEMTEREALLFLALIGKTSYDVATENINNSTIMKKREKAVTRTDVVDFFSSITSALRNIV